MGRSYLDTVWSTLGVTGVSPMAAHAHTQYRINAGHWSCIKCTKKILNNAEIAWLY